MGARTSLNSCSNKHLLQAPPRECQFSILTLGWLSDELRRVVGRRRYVGRDLLADQRELFRVPGSDGTAQEAVEEVEGHRSDGTQDQKGADTLDFVFGVFDQLLELIAEPKGQKEEQAIAED